VRFAIISDIHANDDALRAVLADIDERGEREILCLGDLVGFNAFPRETLELLRERRIPSVYGDHDLMALGWLPLEGAPQAQAAMRWTRSTLRAGDLDYLSSLPASLRPRADMLCVHATLEDPRERLQEPLAFHRAADQMRRNDGGIRTCFTGHTHVAELVVVQPWGEIVRHAGEGSMRLRPNSWLFINPGAVGHANGDDWRAAYAAFDPRTRRVEFRRVAYRRDRVLEENARLGLLPLDPWWFTRGRSAVPRVPPPTSAGE
jgi:predicted phosphodiesterase